MSVIETVSDVSNPLLSRREITCDFAGLAGRLARLDAVDMVTKEYGLDGKSVIPMRLKNHVGRPTITGLFYVYEDEEMARRHVNPPILARLEKSRAEAKEKESAADNDNEGADSENSKGATGDNSADSSDTDKKQEAAS